MGRNLRKSFNPETEVQAKIAANAPKVDYFFKIFYIYNMIEKVAKTTTKNRFDDGIYVEFSRVEVPLSVKKRLFDEYDRIRPQNADLPDEEIQNMVNEVRYGKIK